MAAFKYDGALFDVFNLGESETIQLSDLIAAIESALGKKATINHLPEQPGVALLLRRFLAGILCMSNPSRGSRNARMCSPHFLGYWH